MDFDRLFNELVSSDPEFAKVAKKWKLLAVRNAKKIASTTGVPLEDALQEQLLTMWQAFCRFKVPEAHYRNRRWDVVGSDKGKVRLRDCYGYEVTAKRSEVTPIRKDNLQVSSFVYLRMCQWQANQFTLHFTQKNGYAVDSLAPTTTYIRKGKRKTAPNYIRVVFTKSPEESFSLEDDDAWGSCEGCDFTPPDEGAEFLRYVNHVWKHVGDTDRQVLSACLSDDKDRPRSRESYLCHVTGLSKRQVRDSLRNIAAALPDSIKDTSDTVRRLACAC